jgi:hypothetical protein
VEEQDDYDEILDGKRRVGTNVPIPSLPPPVQIQTSQSSSKPKSAANGEQSFAKPPALPSISFGRHTISPLPPAAISSQNLTAKLEPPLSLSARLEVIASHEEVLQALIALNSWCKMTANASLSFFQHDCYAIEIILQRFCSEPFLIHESNIRIQLTSLLAQLLPPPSFKATETPQSHHIQSVINALTGLLDQVISSPLPHLVVLHLIPFFDQASRATALKISTPLSSSNSAIATQASRLSPLALRLGQSLRKIHQTYEKTRATFSQSGSLFVLDEEIQHLTEAIGKLQGSLASSLPSAAGVAGGATNGMKEKFELREMIFEVFQLQLQVRLSSLFPILPYLLCSSPLTRS